MKSIFKKMLAVLIVSISAISFANSSVNSTLISGSKTLSKSAQYLLVTFNVADANAHCYANVYQEEWPGKQLAHATITIAVDNSSARSLEAIIPNDALAGGKNVVIDCEIPTDRATLIHKIPAPPVIHLNTQLLDIEEHNVRFTSDSYIDNQDPDGTCYSYQYPASFNLLGGAPGESKRFFANYFILDKLYINEIFNHAHIALICQNSGGVTISNHVWERRDGVIQRTATIYEHH